METNGNAEGRYGFGPGVAPARLLAPVPPTTAPQPSAAMSEPTTPGRGWLGIFKGLRLGKAAETADDPRTDGSSRAENPPAALAPPAVPSGPRLRRRRRSRRTWRHEVPAWVVSLVVHLTILGALAMATIAREKGPPPASIDAAPVDTALSEEMSEELIPTLADVNDAPVDQAVVAMPTNTPGPANGLGTGTGAPSSSPTVAARSPGERSLPNVETIPQLSPVATMTPTAPTLDLAGGGRIRGDVTAVTTEVGEALDQLAREILRRLASHKLVVIWAFDESSSMKDDQLAIKEKFDRVAGELRLNLDEGRSSDALTHAIVGYGTGMHFLQDRPTADIDAIGRAIEKVPIDTTGVENTCAALRAIVAKYARYVTDERRVMIILVTDESGDDGSRVEEARQALLSREMPLYVIGRQSLFGYDRAHLRYEDPITHDIYWPPIKRGPETPGAECLQWDGLHERRDEQPSGFAPYELARLVKDSGGIYFLLPSEEEMRGSQREKKYSMATLKEYVPAYESRVDYVGRRDASELRRTLAAIIERTKGFGFQGGFPVAYGPLEEAIVAEYPKVESRLGELYAIERQLRALKVARDREPEPRWRAHYDLMLAQIITYEIKAYEYRACLREMVALANAGKLVPSQAPVPDKLDVEWSLNHSKDRKADPSLTEAKYAEAEALLKAVIEQHPNTPWSDLAQDELDRGFGVARGEWTHSPQYAERAKYVPNF